MDLRTFLKRRDEADIFKKRHRSAKQILKFVIQGRAPATRLDSGSEITAISARDTPIAVDDEAAVW